MKDKCNRSETICWVTPSAGVHSRPSWGHVLCRNWLQRNSCHGRLPISTEPRKAPLGKRPMWQHHPADSTDTSFTRSLPLSPFSGMKITSSSQGLDNHHARTWATDAEGQPDHGTPPNCAMKGKG
jgi:hypothetical protein